MSAKYKNFKNLYRPTVYGIGYTGDGEYCRSVNGKVIPAYGSWWRMLERCYSAACQSEKPTYIGCSVAEEWHNLQVYAIWYHSQPNSSRTGFQLDKDLRIGGNKQYGPDACSFVPSQINSLLTDSATIRGDLPQGVTRNGKGFRAFLKVKGKRVYLSTYSTPDQAFAIYKTAKEHNVKSMAEEWKDYLHPEVYNYLMGWELITQENKTYV